MMRLPVHGSRTGYSLYHEATQSAVLQPTQGAYFCGCAQARPLLGLLLAPYVAGNTVAALLLTTAGLALSTSPPVAARTPKPPRGPTQPPASPDPAAAAPATVTTLVSPSTNGAGPKVVVRRTGAGGSSSSGSNGAKVAIASEEEKSILSVDRNGSNGSGVLLPGNGLEPFKQPGRVTLRTATPGRPRARLQGSYLGALACSTLRARRPADAPHPCRGQAGLRQCAKQAYRQAAVAQRSGLLAGCSGRMV